MKLKKLLSFFLACTMAMGLMSPALATDSNTTSASSDEAIIDASGNKLTFNTIDQGNRKYLLEYYVNDELQTTYVITEDSPQIEATSTDGTTYVIDKTNIVREVESNAVMPAGVIGPDHFATIYYKTNTTFTSKPAASVEITAKTKDKTYTLTLPKQTKFADGVATISSLIIAAGLALVPVSGGTSTVAAAVLESMISAAGGSIVDNVITVAISDKFKCFEETYTYDLTLVTNKFTTTGKLKNAGTTDHVYYDGEDQLATTQDDGYTPTTIKGDKNKEFALTVWGTCTTYACPGLKSYTYYYYA